MNTHLWMMQLVLALVFAGSGIAKLALPVNKLHPAMPWVEDFSPQTVRIIGVLEIMGAIGVIAPSATAGLSWLTPVAAAGLAATMLGGFSVHLRRREYARSLSNVMLFVLAVLVLLGRA